MSSREFAEWQAYYSIQPFGHNRWDLGFAIVAATVANTTRSKESDKVFSVEDFLLVFTEEQQRQLAERDRDKMRQKLNSMFGG